MIKNYWNKIKNNLFEICKLAPPIIVAELSVYTMNIVDTIMVGQFDINQLAYYGLANTFFLILFIAPVGFLHSGMINISNAIGEKNYQKCGQIFKTFLNYSILLGLIIAGISIYGEEIFLFTKQNNVMAKNAGEVFKILGIAMPLILIHINCNNFLNAIKRPKFITIATILANGVNVFFNWLLIYGNWGFGAMGAIGSAWATFIVRIFLCTILIIYIYRMKNIKLFKLSVPLKNWWHNSSEMRKMGYGLGLILLAEVGSFSVLSIFAGWMGEMNMAMFTIIINFTTFVFMTTIGSSTATSVLVGNAYGRKDLRDIKLSTISGLIFGLFIVSILSLILYLYPREIFGLYCSDALIISSIIPLVIYTIMTIPTDCFQYIIFDSLKARNDIKASVYLQSFSFVVILIGSGYYFSTVMNLGVKGLLLGMFTSHSVASILGFSRYVYLNKKVKN